MGTPASLGDALTSGVTRVFDTKTNPERKTPKTPRCLITATLPECTSPTGPNSTEPSDLLRFLARCPTWTRPDMFEEPRCLQMLTSQTPILLTLPAASTALGATWLRLLQIGPSPSHLRPITHQVTQAPAQHPPATIQILIAK